MRLTLQIIGVHVVALALACLLVTASWAGEPNKFDVDPAQCMDTGMVMEDITERDGVLTNHLLLPGLLVTIEVWTSPEDGSWAMFWVHPAADTYCLLAYGPAQILTPMPEPEPEGDPT